MCNSYIFCAGRTKQRVATLELKTINCFSFENISCSQEKILILLS
jgi:hypothetical protein